MEVHPGSVHQLGAFGLPKEIARFFVHYLQGVFDRDKGVALYIGSRSLRKINSRSCTYPQVSGTELSATSGHSDSDQLNKKTQSMSVFGQFRSTVVDPRS